MDTDYRQIVAVTGLPGLYQLVSTKNDGAIVKNLADNAIKFVAARKHQVTPLESIEIYTTSDNIRLHEVFEKMKADDDDVLQLASKKDNEANKAYFKRILPDYDADRVYTSDIHKVIKWYAILKSKDLLNFDYLKAEEASLEEISTDGEVPEADEARDKKESVTGPAEKAGRKKAKKEADDATATSGASKHTATDKKHAASKTSSTAGKEKAPAKKTASKKKTAESSETTPPKKTIARKKKGEG